MAEQAARSCGLPKATCMTLLEAGWTLTMDAKGPTRWEQPIAASRVVVEPSVIQISAGSFPPPPVIDPSVFTGVVAV